MLKCFSPVWEFLNYWYFRYLMVTELYMVEKWERAVCNVTIFLFIILLTYFNMALLHCTSHMFNFGLSAANSLYNSSNSFFST